MLKLAAKSIPAMDLPIIVYERSEDNYNIKQAQSLNRLFKPKTLFLGIPGAFIPTIQVKFLPEYFRYAKEIKALSGISQICVLSVNDPYSLQTFAEEVDFEEKMIFISDWEGKLSQYLNTTFYTTSFGLRSKAFRCVVENSEISHFVVEEDWKISTVTRVYNFLKIITPYHPYPYTTYSN
ncbi:unnamed protein product [Blepharisma stoltei]|uniref:Redoxin domain-containing protein n=1 Tax=Blepharisma stoltei TaxID=1481888 RepID=A0AAU9J6I9_9CILI|nr:unnamed protein product [Blepharisma stoltei]